MLSSPRVFVGWGQRSTSLGTGARRRDIPLPPAPLPAAKASLCWPARQGCSGPATPQPQHQPFFPGTPAQVSSPSAPDTSHRCIFHPPHSLPEIASKLHSLTIMLAGPSWKNGITPLPAWITAIHWIPRRNHSKSVERGGQLYPNNFILKVLSTILKPVSFSQNKLPCQMGILRSGSGADLASHLLTLNCVFRSPGRTLLLLPTLSHSLPHYLPTPTWGLPVCSPEELRAGCCD